MAKKQVVFIHGGEAFSDYSAFITHLKMVPIEDPFQKESKKRWKSTLFEDLGDEYEVIAPRMPNSQNAKYEEWKIWFERHFEFLRDKVMLVGHSQGGYFLAKYLSENEMPITVSALFLISAPYEPDDFGGEDGGDFRFDTTKLTNLEKQVNKTYILHSRDDYVVPYAHAEKYQVALPQAELISFDSKGHFLDESFPELIALIKRGG